MPSSPHPDSDNSSQDLGFFDDRPRLLLITMIILFLLAAVARMYRINAPGLLIDRDYMSAILARDFYFARADGIEEWQREIAHITKQNQPVLEPPVTEFLVSLMYQAAGSERLWLSRVLTSSFWLVGGIFLYRLVRELASTDAAVFATAFYVLAPLSINLSRSFQPDSLMMMLFLIGLFQVSKYYARPSWFRLAVVAGTSGLAFLCRPLVLFALLGAFTAAAVCRKGSWKGMIDGQYLAFLAVSLLPALLYYGYGAFVAGSLRGQAEMSFRPHLLLHREFWIGWLDLAVGSVGLTALTGALIGVPMLRGGFPRMLVIGSGIGYAVFGLAFTMHIHTHGYYHAQLIPIAAISFAPLVALVVDRLNRAQGRWYWWLPVGGALLLALVFDFRQVRSRLGSPVFESGEVARRIGESVQHSSRTVFLSPYYGLPLQYYGELTGAYWPRKMTYWLYRRPGEQARSVEERLNGFGFSPEYFVITDFREFGKHHADLKAYLVEKECPLIAEEDQYLIYELKACIGSPVQR